MDVSGEPLIDPGNLIDKGGRAVVTTKFLGQSIRVFVQFHT